MNRVVGPPWPGLPCGSSPGSCGDVPWEVSAAGDRTGGRDRVEGVGVAWSRSEPEPDVRELTGPHLTTSLPLRISPKGRPVDAVRRHPESGPSLDGHLGRARVFTRTHRPCFDATRRTEAHPEGTDRAGEEGIAIARIVGQAIGDPRPRPGHGPERRRPVHRGDALDRPRTGGHGGRDWGAHAREPRGLGIPGGHPAPGAGLDDRRERGAAPSGPGVHRARGRGGGPTTGGPAGMRPSRRRWSGARPTSTCGRTAGLARVGTWSRSWLALPLAPVIVERCESEPQHRLRSPGSVRRLRDRGSDGSAPLASPRRRREHAKSAIMARAIPQGPRSGGCPRGLAPGSHRVRGFVEPGAAARGEGRCSDRSS